MEMDIDTPQHQPDLNGLAQSRPPPSSHASSPPLLPPHLRAPDPPFTPAILAHDLNALISSIRTHLAARSPQGYTRSTWHAGRTLPASSAAAPTAGAPSYRDVLTQAPTPIPAQPYTNRFDIAPTPPRPWHTPATPATPAMPATPQSAASTFTPTFAPTPSPTAADIMRQQHARLVQQQQRDQALWLQMVALAAANGYAPPPPPHGMPPPPPPHGMPLPPPLPPGGVGARDVQRPGRRVRSGRSGRSGMEEAAYRRAQAYSGNLRYPVVSRGRPQ
ncbi:hypothetical protein EDC01DRAFT_725792 [Geopyxis carbonaria]|nr:hypothetical protein EDC01DRAFT_725792 [Geopyxis carbonaria]